MIECKVKCKCTDGEIMLPMRERLDSEDIRDYMGYIQNKIGAWHSKRMCSETKLEYLKIPLEEDKPIGVR